MSERRQDRLPALDELRQELIDAIDARAAARRSSRRQCRSGPLISLLAVVLAVAVVILLTGSSGTRPAVAVALERAANIAAHGASPPPLHPGEYWYIRAVDITPLPIELPRGRKSVTIEVAQRAVSEAWIGVLGITHIRETPLGAPRFTSARDRERWLDAGAPPMYASVVAENRIVRGQPGFPPNAGAFYGNQLLTYQQLQTLPSDPAQLLARIRDALTATERRVPNLRIDATGLHIGKFNTIEGLLLSPAPRAVTAGLYRAAALIPGVRYLGETTDPLGRQGLAIELDTPGEHRRVIYNPRTAALLSQLSDFGGPPHPGVYDSESYTASGVVSSPRALPRRVAPVGHPTPLATRLRPIGP
jgi:hypothetical protein